MSQIVLAPHQLLLIKFFHDYTLDLESKSTQKSVSFKKSSLASTDQALLESKNQQTDDSSLIEQDGDIIIGENIRRIYAKMLNRFEPKDTIDTQIYEQVVGTHQSVIEDAQRLQRLNTEILDNTQRQRQIVMASDDVRLVVSSLGQNNVLDFKGPQRQDTYDSLQINEAEFD